LEDFSEILDKLISDTVFYTAAAETAGRYITKNTGATAIILREIFG
jgi:hypothetical protein